MKYCTIYCRVSSNKQSNYQDGHVSLEVQENVCREYAKKNNFLVKKVYRDVGSARNMNNQYYLKHIIKNIVTGDTILFHDSTRFSRNTLQALKCLEKLEKKKISIHSVVEDCGYKSFSDKHTFRLLLAKAENESDQISARVKSSILFRRKRGDYIGTAPYGWEAYKNDDGVRKIRHNKDEQYVIQFICKLVNDNKPYWQIAEKLNEMQIDKRGYTWTDNSVGSVVKSNNSNVLKSFTDIKKSLQNVESEKPKKKKIKYNLRN